MKPAITADEIIPLSPRQLADRPRSMASVSTHCHASTVVVSGPNQYGDGDVTIRSGPFSMHADWLLHGSEANV